MVLLKKGPAEGGHVGMRTEYKEAFGERGDVGG